MAQEKEYFAFISYQRKDEEWADRLRNKLEHYRLPSSVRKQDASLPKEIRPIFRDALELAGGVLAKEIETALQQSKYLIVICSPNSAKSPWVNKEIQTFIDLGREEYIIPFIIDGTPYSEDPETECCPPSLHSLRGENEILGINIDELGREAATVKVVARMFGLKFDMLWQRFEREQKKKRRTKILALAALTLFAFGMALYIWHENVLLQEKDWSIMQNRSRAIAEKASTLTDDGDSYLAQLLAISSLPVNLNHPDRPYCIESEILLRNSTMYNNMILHLSDNISNMVYLDQDKMLTLTDDSTLCVWDLNSGACIKKQKRNYGTAIFSKDGKTMACPHTFVNYTPDHKYVISTEYGIDIVDVESGKQLKRLDGYKEYQGPLFFSSDAQYLYSSEPYSYKVYKWNLSTGKATGAYEINHQEGNIMISLNDAIIASRVNDTVFIWRGSDGAYINKFVVFDSNIKSISISPKGQRIVSASDDGTVKIWDVPMRRVISTFGHGCAGVKSIKYSNSGKFIVSTHDDNSIRIWETTSNKCIKEYHVNNQIWGTSLSPLDNFVSFCAGSGRTIQVIGVDLNYKQKYIQSIKENVNNSFWSPDGRFVISENDSNKYLWDASSGKIISKFGCDILIENGAVSSPNGKYVLSRHLGNGLMYLLESSTGEKICDFGEKFSAFFNYNGDTIVTTSTNTINLYSVHSKKLIGSFSDNVITAFISPDSRYIVSIKPWRNTLSDGEIHIIDTKDGKTIYKHGCSTSYGESVTFSPDSKYFCSATEYGKLLLWDLLEKQYIGCLEGDKYEILRSYNSRTVFSQDGNYILSICKDNTIRVWDVKTLKCILNYSEPNFNVITASFSRSGDSIIMIADNGTMKSLSWLPLQQLIDQTRMRFRNRSLSKEERHTYYLD